ncbi:hypothetical protein BBJ28_00022343 [Nothophytophthora sp. Chile5]|nr:hypothetical protein BBJ28_00022343 [Nothophytophthora sp. Chile5]
MGTGRTKGKPRAHASKKQYKRGHATKNRSRDVDQIQDDLRVETLKGKPMAFEEDEDLPGCATEEEKRSLTFACALAVGIRLKDVAQKQYTQKEAMLGAGKTVETYTPAHPKPADAMEDL